MIKNISVVIIVKNGEKTLKNTLNSVKSFSDVVVYDNGSSDNTQTIANTFSNVNLVSGDFLGFGPTKNKAISYAQNDWILSLDADEVLSAEFVQNLGQIKLENSCVYSINRHNYYQQKHIKHCWGNDVIIRVFNKQETGFNDNLVHEKIIKKDTTIIKLDGFVNHYPYNDIADFIIKLDRYSTEFAKENVGKRHSSPLKAILNASFSFCKTYLLKRGFLDGYAGLVIAFSHAATNFYKYIKLYEFNQKNR